MLSCRAASSASQQAAPPIGRVAELEEGGGKGDERTLAAAPQATADAPPEHRELVQPVCQPERRAVPQPVARRPVGRGDDKLLLYAAPNIAHPALRKRLQDALPPRRHQLRIARPWSHRWVGGRAGGRAGRRPGSGSLALRSGRAWGSQNAPNSLGWRSHASPPGGRAGKGQQAPFERSLMVAAQLAPPRAAVASKTGTQKESLPCICCMQATGSRTMMESRPSGAAEGSVRAGAWT